MRGHKSHQTLSLSFPSQGTQLGLTDTPELLVCRQDCKACCLKPSSKACWACGSATCCGLT